MPQLEDSIVLIISSDAKKTEFGTGFIVARAHGYSYLLTCAHVVEQINGKPPTENKLKISGLDAPVDIVAHGASDGIDMALLKVAGLFDKPPSNLFMLGQEKADIKVTGYSLFDSKHGQRVQRELNGKLTKRVKIAANNQEYPFLDIAIQDDDFSKLDGGYSGSPLYNSSGHVLGVVSHKRTGEMGHAFCISNLIHLYPDIETILPNFKQLIESSQKTLSLSDIRTRLIGKRNEISKVYLKLRDRLNRMNDEVIDDEAEFILLMCEDFLKGEMNAADFMESCFPFETSKNLQPNYTLLAESLKNGHVCLCLGTELPKLFDPKLNSAQELAQRIATLSGFARKNAHELAEICEYAQLRSTDTPRHRVVEELKQLITPNYQPKIELYELLARVEKPFLVIATGFDTLLEQRLSKSGHSFVSIVINKEADIAADQRYLVKGFNTKQNEGSSRFRGVTTRYGFLYPPTKMPGLLAFY